MDIEERILRLVEIVGKYTKDSLQNLAYDLQGFVGVEMEFAERNDKDPEGPSSSSNVRTGKGALYRSFQPKNPNNINRYSANGDTHSIEYGSNLIYASVHEYGKEIKAKPYTKTITRKNSKTGKESEPFTKEGYKMADYFWYRYKENPDNSYYKNLAIHVEQTGSVTVPARPFFYPALEKYMKDTNGFQSIINKIFDALEKDWTNGGAKS